MTSRTSVHCKELRPLLPLPQGLGAVVTDIHKLKNTDQRLYLYASKHGSNTIVHGGLKIGTKRLFVTAVSVDLQLI
jgi:hypothetical protein